MQAFQCGIGTTLDFLFNPLVQDWNVQHSPWAITSLLTCASQLLQSCTQLEPPHVKLVSVVSLSHEFRNWTASWVKFLEPLVHSCFHFSTLANAMVIGVFFSTLTHPKQLIVPVPWASCYSHGNDLHPPCTHTTTFQRSFFIHAAIITGSSRFRSVIELCPHL